MFNLKLIRMKTQQTTIDFKGHNIYIGLDTHKISWKVTILTDTISHKTFTQPPEPEVLFNYLKRNFPGANYFSAYEASYCGFWIHQKLSNLGIHSIVVNPADIPTTNKEVVQKEDMRDSRKIASCLRNGELNPIFIPSQKNLEDRTLVRLRITISKDLRRLKNRVKSFLLFYGINIPPEYNNNSRTWTKRLILWLEGVELTQESGKVSLQMLVSQVKILRSSQLDILRKIRSLSQSSSYKKDIELLLGVPGIGLKTAMLFLTEIVDIKRFKNLDHLCSYIGLIPSTHSSGEKDYTGTITSRGHSTLRTAIIESAWVAAKNDPALLLAYNELCKKMKPNKAITRIAKKLLAKIRSVLINEQAYKKSYITNNP